MMRKKELKPNFTRRKTDLKDKGITLIALVVTIIILLILAGVTLNMALSDNGLLKRAQESVDKYKQAENDERDDLEKLSNYIQSTGTEQDLTRDFVVSKGVNKPKITTGLKPVTISGGTIEPVSQDSDKWYDYNNKNWANAQSDDDSLWVWIPRFAYKLNDSTHKADIVFLKGTTDEPADKTSDGISSNEITIKRVQDLGDEPLDDKTYIVHPAFCKGSDTGYANGEWSKELTGFWVAKFEAGYPEATDPKKKDSSIKYSDVRGEISTYYGEITEGTAITFPKFQANRPGMNFMQILDAYRVCQEMSNAGNPYGFDKSVNSHLTKNSEWGAIAYLSQSQYGKNGELNINNIQIENDAFRQRTITGYGASSADADVNSITNFQPYLKDNGAENNWTTANGQNASSTGNITGVYDLSGGLWELTTAYIEGENTTKYGGDIFGSGETNQYITKYENSYENNKKIGDAILETSDSGVEAYGWNGDRANYFDSSSIVFLVRGGAVYRKTEAGVFAFGAGDGAGNHWDFGFRAVLTF